MSVRRRHPIQTPKASRAVSLGANDPRSRRNAQALTADTTRARDRRGVLPSGVQGLAPLPATATAAQIVERLNALTLDRQRGT